LIDASSDETESPGYWQDDERKGVLTFSLALWYKPSISLIPTLKLRSKEKEWDV
jgi:hypothetical protein